MALINVKTIAKAKDRNSMVTKGGVVYQSVDTAALAEVANIAKNLASNSSDWTKIDQKDKAVLAAALKSLAAAMEESDGKYLSKVHADTAAELITFLKGFVSQGTALLRGGAEFGHFVQGITGGRIDSIGNGELESLLVRDSIVVPNLTVTKAAHFFKLIIDELKSIGGQIIVTAANATLDKVVAMTSANEEAQEGDTIAYWRCYFRAKDADGKAIHNQFATNDMAVCMTFDAAEGTSYNVSNKYYWRKVVGTGTVTLSDETGETNDYHYIDMSYTDKDPDCNGEPEVGDAVAQLGNRTDTSRQNAIIISAYQGIDATVQAPSIVQYKGINDYSLSTHKYNVIAANGNVFHGQFVSIAGSSGQEQNLDDLIEGLNDQVEAVRGQVDNKFEIWYGNGVPTLDNEPAVNWTDTETRNLHLQDIYYDLTREPASSGGNCYRFELTNGTYGWNVVTDEHTLMALNKISDVATDGKLTGGAEKVRVFLDWEKASEEYLKYTERAADYAITTQLTAYRNAFKALGKLLNNGGDLITSDTMTQIPTPAWLTNLQVTTVIPSPDAYRQVWADYYTTLAALLQEIQRVAKALANAAQTTATNAMNLIGDMGSDNLLDPSEKLTVKREFIAHYHEMMGTDEDGYVSGILDMAKDSGGYYIVDEQDVILPYIDAFEAIGKYLNGNATWMTPDLEDFDDDALPSWIQEDNMSNTNTISGDVWRNKWADFYTKRTAVLTALSENAQATADKAQADVIKLASDGIISAGSEKSRLLIEWSEAVEKYKILSETCTHYDAYDSYADNFIALATMLNGGDTPTDDILDGTTMPLWINSTNLSRDTTVNAYDYRNTWNAYYEHLEMLMEELRRKKVSIFVIATTDDPNHPVPPYNAGDMWIVPDRDNKTLVCINGRTTGNYVASDWKDMTDIKSLFRTMVEKMLLDGTIRNHIEYIISNSSSSRIWFLNGNGYRMSYVTSLRTFIMQQYVSREWVTVTPSRGWIVYQYIPNGISNGIFVYNGTAWVSITNDGLSTIMDEILNRWGERYSTCYTNKSSSAVDLDLCIRDVGYWDTLENRQQSTGLKEIFMYNRSQWELISDSVMSLLENLGDKIRALVYDANGHSLIAINANNILLETAARLEGDRKNFPVLKPWLDSTTDKPCTDFLSDPIRYNGNHDIYSYPTWLKAGTYKLKFFVSCSQSTDISSIAVCQYGTSFPSDRTMYTTIDLHDVNNDGTALAGMYGFSGVVEIPSDGYYALNWWEDYYIYIPDTSDESETLAAQLTAGLSTKVNINGNGANAFATLFANAVNNDGNIVKQAQLSAYVQTDANGKIVTGISLDADQINFTGKTVINGKFIVDNQGNVTMNYATMNNATISGTITATSGKIGGFKISGNGLTNANDDNSFTNDAYIILRNDTHDSFVGIGPNVLPVYSTARALGRFEIEDQNDWFGTGQNIALVLRAKNAAANFAFLGEGNGVLEGWIGGKKWSRYVCTQNNTINGGVIKLKENNIWFVKATASNAGVELPRLSEVRTAIGAGSNSNFCVRLIINADLGGTNFVVYGRNKITDSSNNTPWDIAELPLIINANGGNEDGYEIGSGDTLEFLLVYDTNRNGITIDGYDSKYTARLIYRTV